MRDCTLRLQAVCMNIHGTRPRLLIILFVAFTDIFRTFFFLIFCRRKVIPSDAGNAKRWTLCEAMLVAVSNVSRLITRTGCGFPRTYRINYRYAETRRLRRSEADGPDGQEGIVNESIKRGVCVGQDRVRRTPCVYAPSPSIVFSPTLQPRCIWNSA